jgi:hypothetical protein
MFGGTRRAVRVGLLAGCALSIHLGNAGCGPSDALGRAGVTLLMPPGWSAVPASTWPVPGTSMAAFRGPGGESLVIYRSLPAPGSTASELGTALIHRLENMPGLQVLRRSELSLGESLATRVELTAPGTGDAFAPTGMGVPATRGGKPLRPTRRVVILIPRPADTLGLVWHAPEEEAKALDGQVDATLAGLSVGKGTMDTSSY